MVPHVSSPARFAAFVQRFLTDSDISEMARGILAELVSRPPDWIPSIAHLQKCRSKTGHHRTSRASIVRALDELIEAGYMTRDVVEKEKRNGRFERGDGALRYSLVNRSGIRAMKGDENYVRILNSFVQNRDLTYAARGLMLRLMSKPASWRIKIGLLVEDMTIGIDALRTILKELAEAGFLRRTSDGTSGTHYVITNRERIALMSDQKASVTPEPKTASQQDGTPENGETDTVQTIDKYKLLIPTNDESDKGADAHDEGSLTGSVKGEEGRSDRHVPERRVDDLVDGSLHAHEIAWPKGKRQSEFGYVRRETGKDFSDTQLHRMASDVVNWMEGKGFTIPAHGNDRAFLSRCRKMLLAFARREEVKHIAADHDRVMKVERLPVAQPDADQERSRVRRFLERSRQRNRIEAGWRDLPEGAA